MRSARHYYDRHADERDLTAISLVLFIVILIVEWICK